MKVRANPRNSPGYFSCKRVPVSAVQLILHKFYDLKSVFRVFYLSLTQTPYDTQLGECLSKHYKRTKSTKSMKVSLTWNDPPVNLGVTHMGKIFFHCTN